MKTTNEMKSYQEDLKGLKENLSKMLPSEVLETFASDAEALQNQHNDILKLNVGDKAPNFTLPNAVSQRISLYDILKNERVVLTFYRGLWCPYCNLTLNKYQEALELFKEAGATIVAISPQNPDNSMNIKEKNALQYEVLSDKGNEVTRLFTTVHNNPEESLKKMTELGYDYDSFYDEKDSKIPVPATFIIEQDGTVSFAKTEGGDYRNRVEVADILNILNK